MEQVKRMVDAGARIPTAIKEALMQRGLSVTAFAEKHDISESVIRNAINGLQRASEPTLAALSSELGGTPDAWAELLWLAAKPPVLASAGPSDLPPAA